MISTIPSKMDLKLIAAEAATFTYTSDDGYIEMAAQQGKAIEERFLKLPGIGAAIKEISGFRRGLKPVSMMLNVLKPGAPVPKHRDWIPPTPLQRVKPCIERWHLAVVTAEGVDWWDEQNEKFHMPQGFWSGPVPYWNLHTAINASKVERLHLIVDLDTPERIGEYAEDRG